MLRISLAFIFTLFQFTSLTQIFNKTADEIFKSIIGDVHVLKKINPPKRYSELRAIEDAMLAKNMKQVISINDTHVKMRYKNESTSTTEKVSRRLVTSLPPEKNLNLTLTIDDAKVRMRKIHLNQLLERQTSPIPDFSKDDDNPTLITRRFDQINRQEKQQKVPNLSQLYFYREDQTRIYWEKQRTIALMEHFIYATRYKLPYVQLLRNKYRHHYKYKIGYCFALLRHLKQQQKLIYTSLHNYYTSFSNLMIHLKLYEKVVRLDVDIKDLIQYIHRLNYLRKIDETPDYYVDSPEQPGKLPFGRKG